MKGDTSIQEQMAQHTAALTDTIENDTACRQRYNLCAKLARYTKMLLQQGDMNTAKRYCSRISNIYKAGTANTRQAIENVYVYSVGKFLLITGGKESMDNVLPARFRKILIKQMIGSGI